MASSKTVLSVQACKQLSPQDVRHHMESSCEQLEQPPLAQTFIGDFFSPPPPPFKINTLFSGATRFRSVVPSKRKQIVWFYRSLRKCWQWMCLTLFIYLKDISEGGETNDTS